MVGVLRKTVTNKKVTIFGFNYHIYFCFLSLFSVGACLLLKPKYLNTDGLLVF